MRKKWNKEWIKALKKAFEPPAPVHKTEFLQKISPSAELSLFAFLLVQLRYIRKRIWIVSVLVFGCFLSVSLILSVDRIQAVSAFTPLLALSIIAESGRSEIYGMAELEMATRFSLKSVLLARLGILGLGNLLLLCLLFPISLSDSRIPPLRAGFYIVTPFLLTTFCCLHIVRRHRERESIYLCAGVSACISFFILNLRLSIPLSYEETPFICWVFAAALLGTGIVKQYRDLIRQEELTWNLS